MKISTQLKNVGAKLCSSIIFLLLALSSIAQVTRPYNIIYSNNLKGGHTIFGNTIMNIAGNNGAVLLNEMNDFGSYGNGETSQYGNDNSNMQYVDIDGPDPDVTIVDYGTSWNYSDANSEPSGWPNVNSLPGGPGAAPLGYGPTGTVSTTLTDRRTYYFTRVINFNPATYSNYIFNINLDDGAIVYVNGTQVGRINMNSGNDYTTNADNNREPESVSSLNISAADAGFINGNNTIQVEVHTSANNESGTDDLFFDLQLIGKGNSTINSSSADLILPAAGTNTIKYARMYWGGRVKANTGMNNFQKIRTVQIRKGSSGGYTTVIAPSTQLDITRSSDNDSKDSIYQAYVDITDFIKAGGGGTYTVGNVSCATGSVDLGGRFGGWSIVVVYENPTSTYSSVRVYDGYLQVYDGGDATNTSITLNGLNAPVTPLNLSDVYMSVMGWEGDADLAASNDNPAGDYIKLNDTLVSNARNPKTNFWNGTISRNGVDVTTKSPNYINQFGIDIDEMQVGQGFNIQPNATEAKVEFGTEADKYFPSLFAFTMATKEPNIYIDKTVTDGTFPPNVLTTNEILTYTLSGANIGVGPAYKCTVVDTIPSNITYVPGSMEILSCPNMVLGAKSDVSDADEAFVGTSGSKTYVKFFIGKDATSSLGGELQSGESYSIRFKAITSANANQISAVVNFARITGEGISGDQYVDDATAIIGPEGGPLFVKMTDFSVVKDNGGNASVKWVTVSEDKNDHFIIQQSTDGINFTNIGTVPGSGTSSLTNRYQFSGAITNNSVPVIYYRLMIYDKDNNIAVTKIIALHLNDISFIKGFSVYPNPFINSVKIRLNNDVDEMATVRLVNALGQLVIKRTIALQPNVNIVELRDLGNLTKGVYNIEVATKGWTTTQRIIKN